METIFSGISLIGTDFSQDGLPVFDLGVGQPAFEGLCCHPQVGGRAALQSS